MKALTAPMGWNSWDCYGTAVTEETVRRNAEFMAENLKQYGWEYIVVDIQWYEPMAATHEYHPFTDLIMDEYGSGKQVPFGKGREGFWTPCGLCAFPGT